MPRKRVRLRHAADAEGRRAGEQEQPRRRPGPAPRAGAAAGAPAVAGHPPAARRRDGEVERRVLGEDRLVQAPQLGAGLDADLFDERGARIAVGLERLRLATAAVQREHALGVQPLAQRMLVDQRLELADHLAVAAGVEVVVDRQLGRAQSQLVEPPDLGAPRTARRRRRRAPSPRHSAERLAGAPVVEQALEAQPRRRRRPTAAARSRARE